MYSHFLILLHRHAASRSQVASHLLVYPRRGRRERLMQRCFSRRHARPGPAAGGWAGAQNRHRSTPQRGRWHCANWAFAYPSPDGKTASFLHTITLTASTGRFVALVGTTGSGETSVVKLPESAARSNDEGGIRHDNLQGFRGQLAVWSRGAVPYSGTIRDSIIGDGDETDGAVGQACRDANVWGLVPCSPSVSITIDSKEGLNLGWSLEHSTRNPYPLDSLFSSDHEASKSQAGRSRA